MSYVTLAVRDLQVEQMLLRQGGLYWVSIDQTSDVGVLARQFLAALPAQHSVTLVCCGYDLEQIFSTLDDRCGLAELKLFDVSETVIHFALKSLPSELSRTELPFGSQILLILPVSSWHAFDTELLQRWCDDTRRWLRERNCTLLVLAYGQAPKLDAELVRLNEHLSGLVQLYRYDGSIHYQSHFWHNEQGVYGARDFELDLQVSGFGVIRAEQVRSNTLRTDDQRIYLVQRAVLEGAVASSEHWRVFDRRIDLLQQASSARAASVMVAIESDQQVEVLARELYELRECCGAALKIIVREMEPCLRYRDERLLMSCGANIIVPFGNALSRFFSMVDSVQGQLWSRRRSNGSLDSLLARLRPPTTRGLLAPVEFLSTLDQIYYGASGEVEHQLLRLQPRSSLAIEQCLYQVSLRRFGDIATVVDGVLYLFLFACRNDGLEPALGNICRLPWRTLFSDCRPLDELDELPRVAFRDAGLPDTLSLAPGRAEMATQTQVRAEKGAYMPRRTSLAITDYCA